MTASRIHRRPLPYDVFADGDGVRWWVGKTEQGSVHVVPTNDTYPHSMSGDCPCGVHAEGWSGDLCWIHDSFDGREAFETGQRRSS